MSTYKSKLHQMSMEYPTEYWNDSCSEEELKYAISHGAVGATSNPTIVHAVLKNELHLWRDRIHALLLENPTWSETELTWKLFEEMAVYGAGFLQPTFEKYQGKKGRLSIQTNPALYRNAAALTDQAVNFNSLAPNMIVKDSCHISRHQGHRRGNLSGDLDQCNCQFQRAAGDRSR